MQAVKKTSAIAFLAVALLFPGLVRALAVGKVTTVPGATNTLLKVATKGEAKVKVAGDGLSATIFVAAGERELKGISIAKGLVKAIAFSKAEGGLNILLSLRQASAIRLGKIETQGFEVALSPLAAASTDEAADLNPKIAGYTYRVVELALQGDAAKSELVISADGPANYKHTVLDNNKTLRLVFHNSALAWTGDSARLKDEAIDSVDVKQINSGGEASVRVDIRLSTKLDYSFQRDQNQLVVRLVKPLSEKANPKRGSLEALVTLDVQNADLVGVIKVLCEQAGFEYLITKDLLSKTGLDAAVTLKAEGKTFREVLNSILGGLSARFVRQGNTLFIGTDSEVTTRVGRLPTITRTYTPKYLAAKQLSALMLQQYAFDDAARDRFTKGAFNDPRDQSRLLLVGTSDEINEWIGLFARYDAPEGGVSAEGGEGGIETRVFSFQYLRDNTLVEAAVAQTFPYDKPLTSFDSPTRRYVVTGNGYVLAKVAKIVRNLDVRQAQVNIEAKIVEVSQGSDANFGVSWNARKPAGSFTINQGALQTGSGTNKFTQIALGYVSGGINLDNLITAAVQDNKADVISSPNITVSDNEAAQIKITDTIAFGADPDQIISNGVPIVVPKSQQQAFPLILDVKPMIAKMVGKIMLDIQFDLTSQSGPQQGTLLAPTSVQHANTKVSVSNGETAVIGGLVRQSSSVLENKIPVLGDIPLLGALFKYKQENKQKKEVIIFITPTIVEN